MAKQSGLGDRLFVAGYDLSGDVGSIGTIAGGPSPLDVTAINKSAMERIGGLRTGRMEFTVFFNPATDQAHDRLSALPTGDQGVAYLRGTTLGNPAALQVAKQVNYDGSRSADGSLNFSVEALANGTGVEWGRQLTAGLRTDTGATNGSSIDTVASVSHGAQVYLQVSAFTGTDVTVKVQDSADDSSFADLTGGTFTQITGGAPLTERILTGRTQAVRRYLRVATVTTGGFSNLAFVVAIVKNESATAF